jgi:ATP-binding cassette subfamily B multidrug efflux pump
MAEDSRTTASAAPTDPQPSGARSSAAPTSKPTDMRASAAPEQPSAAPKGPAGSGPRRPNRPPHHGPGAMMPGEKAGDFRGTMRKLLRYMGAFKVSLAVLVAFAVGSTVFSVIGPKVLSTATTELFNGLVAKVSGTGGIDFAAIAQILVTTLALYGLSWVCSFVQSWLMASISQRTAYRMRKDIVEKIDRMSLAEIERRSTGDVLSRITNDVDTLGQSLNQGVTQLITSTVTVVGVIAVMLTMNVLMTLIALVIIPVSAVLVSLIVKRSQKYFKAQQQSLGRIDAQVEETFSGQDVVRAFNRQDRVKADFAKTNDMLYESAWRSQFLSALMMPMMTFVSNLGYVAIAILGAYLAAQRVITVGDIQAFIQYVRNLTQPITQLAQVFNVLQQMAAAAERIFEFLEAPEPHLKHAEGELPDAQGDIDFDHVRFGYDPDKPVIKDFTAHASHGQTVALVGPTGAGKTTLVKLLMRFYDVQGGAIRIDGVDIRDVDIQHLRSQFGMVLQDTWLFAGTIRENIRYGRLDATDEEVEAAAKAALVHHFIMTLPDGYDTVINEDASNISQGQRQLLTIARTFLANRRMLILDEATSSVDTRTEQHIQEAMDRLMQGRTSFVIAHRLSTIRNADLILVVNDGDIVEQGTHDGLLAQGGFYAELYNSQFANGEEF